MCVCVGFFPTAEGTVSLVVASLRRRGYPHLASTTGTDHTHVGSCVDGDGLVTFFRRRQDSGDLGTCFEDRACPKPGANKSAHVGGMKEGSVCVSLHEGSHLFYLGVCISIH